MKTILLFQHSLCESNRNMFAGIFHYAQKAGWRIQSIPYAQAAKDRRVNRKPDSVNIPAIVDFWKPDGCIVQGQDTAGGKPDKGDFGRTPVVFLDRYPQSLPPTAFCVYSDSSAVAEAAARELLSLGLEAFAFVDWWQDEIWNSQRGRIFDEILTSHAKQCHYLSLPPFEDGSIESFSQRIASLPRPCGVFCANDLAASRFIAEACHMGFEIPSDFAVIGVDNDKDLCETSPVSISSIQQDCFAAGLASAELLSRVMSGNAPSGSGRKVKFGTLNVARRASTRLLQRKDVRVSAALEYIRLNACTPDIDVGAVAGIAKCSRRQLDALFRSLVKHSVLSEIHARRIERASQLLRQRDLAISKIARVCGYRSASDFSRAFKRETSASPRAAMLEQSGSRLSSKPGE